MGVAQLYCCVGGRFTCIGTWGGRNSPCPALIIRLGLILDYIFPECKRFFGLYFVRAAFLLFRRWLCVVSAAGWPATGGAGVRDVIRSKAGNKVGTLHGLSPWDNPSLSCPAGHGTNILKSTIYSFLGIC